MKLQPLSFDRGMANPEVAIANMRENSKRDLPWFLGMDAHPGSIVPVAGGPSLRSRLGKIKARKRAGECIVALNGTLKLLKAHGIKPDVAAFLDTSEAVLGFIDDEPDDCLYLVASACDPKVFDKLEGRRIVLWHADIADPQQDEIINGYPHKPASLIGGGNTIGLRIMNLGYLLGFRTFHYYGLDSSFADDGRDHAYTKHDGEEPESMTVVFRDKQYRCSPWMARQADEFKNLFFPMFARLGCDIHVHGEGLIPDIAREFRALARAA